MHILPWVLGAAVGVSAQAVPGVRVHGAVVADSTGAPVPLALIEVVGDPERAWTDSVGMYSLRLPQSGMFHLRVVRSGYWTRVVDVIAGGDSAMRVDVVLVQNPVTLAAVAIRGIPLRSPISSGTPLVLDPGSVRLTGAALHDNPATAAADPLIALGSASGGAVLPDAPAGLNVRGGSTDQNIVLVDEIPVYGPYHIGGTLSAINPDVVASVTMHGGAPPASLGGALSGIISMRTVGERPTKLMASGALEGGTIRQMVAAPLPWAEGWFAMAARRSARVPMGVDARDGGAAAGFSDLFLKSGWRAGPGTVDLLLLSANNHLRFDAVPDGAEPAGAAPAGGSADAADREDHNVESAAPRNVFTSRALTLAAVWRVGDTTRTSAVVRSWYGSSAASSTWADSMNGIGLTNSLTTMGLGGRVAWGTGPVRYEAGAGFEDVSSAYDVRPRPGAAGSRWGIAGAAPEVSAFAATQWTILPRWRLVAGVRASDARGSQPLLEPRLAASVEVTPKVRFTAGYARLHQRRHSLRNDESLVDGVFGLPLFSIAGRHVALPVGVSDQLSAALVAEPSQTVSIALDAFARQLTGLALAAPATGEPFATLGTVRGRGAAFGASASARFNLGPGWIAAGYELGSTSRTVGRVRYTPGYGVTHRVRATGAITVVHGTTLQAALWGMLGRPSSVTAGTFRWFPGQLTDGDADLAGSPRRFAAPLGSGRLPNYWRLDIGLRREFRPGILGDAGGITTMLTLSNVLGRRNVLGATAPAAGASGLGITFPSRAVVAGVRWRY